MGVLFVPPAECKEGIERADGQRYQRQCATQRHTKSEVVTSPWKVMEASTMCIL